MAFSAALATTIIIHPFPTFQLATLPTLSYSSESSRKRIRPDLLLLLLLSFFANISRAVPIAKPKLRGKAKKRVGGAGEGRVAGEKEGKGKKEKEKREKERKEERKRERKGKKRKKGERGEREGRESRERAGRGQKDSSEIKNGQAAGRGRVAIL